MQNSEYDGLSDEDRFLPSDIVALAERIRHGDYNIPGYDGAKITSVEIVSPARILVTATVSQPLAYMELSLTVA